MCQGFFISALEKKKNQHKRGFLGTSYLTLPEMEKRILRGKRRDNPICRCYFPSHVSENFIAVKGIHKKKKRKKVITDAICQPLKQILLYIKHNDVFEMQLFQKPQDSAFRDVQKVLFMLFWILRQIFCSVLFQLYFLIFLCRELQSLAIVRITCHS